MFADNEYMLLEKEKVVRVTGMSDNQLVLKEMGPITDLDKLKKVAEAIEAAKNKNLDSNLDENIDTDGCTEEGVETINEYIEEEGEMTMDEDIEEDGEMTIDESLEEEDEATNDKSHEEVNETTFDESCKEMDETIFDKSIDEEDETTFHESVEEDEMTIDDTDYEMAMMQDSETADQSEEVMFPPITQDSTISRDSADELEQIREQIVMDNDKSSEDGKIDQIDEQQLDVEKKLNVELEKIQLQILVDNIQAAEEIEKKPSEINNDQHTNVESEGTVEPDRTVEREGTVEPIGNDKPQETVKPMKKIDIYEWKESETLPKGWKLKKTRKMSFVKELFLSPEEYIFCSRREALKSLVDNNAETDEIEYMRLALKHESWKDSATLPEGWKFRKTKFQTFFCTENGILFKSCEEALEHIKAEHQELTDPFLSAFKIETSKDEGRKGWEANDSVPDGWKIRKAEGKKTKNFFLSPHGIQFSSRVKALQYLVKEKFDEEEIVVMRATLSNEKYSEYRNLPTGWMFK